MNQIDWDELDGRTLTLKPQDPNLVGNVLCEFKTLDGEDPGLKICGGKSDGDKIPDEVEDKVEEGMDDPSPGARSLASVSTRVVSAALRLFVGI